MNSKFIKTKRNRMLEANFFRPFRVLHPIGKQAYKLELSKKWRIYDVFYVSLLEQDITRKGQEFSVPEFESGNDKEYEVETIQDSVVYVRESESDHLPDFCYLVSWKGYLEEENTWEPASAVQHLRKLISLFHKDHPDKPTVTSPAIDTAPLIASPIVRPTEPLKRKHGRPTGRATKCTKTHAK